MPRVRYDEMLPHEIREARTACPIAYVPIGGIEWHGEHLAVGNDTLKVAALAVRCAEKGGGLAFPPLFYGENREMLLMDSMERGDQRERIAEKMGWPADSMAPGFMRRSAYEQDIAYVELLLHILRQMEGLDFKVTVLLAGHYPLLKHAYAAVELHHLTRSTKAWACTGWELVRDVFPRAADHAGKWETSLLMALRPECVDLSRLPSDPEERLVGVGGIHPREASAEFGREAVGLIVERIVEKVHQLLEDQRAGGGPMGYFGR